MGIPGFFKWLTDAHHYPDITEPYVECNLSYGEYDANKSLDKIKPNKIECDNLYLDMNEIIHSSIKSKAKNEDELIATIFRCIDRIFSIVRPRKLLYLAIDGVAPRAKLNQQRTRRFVESKDALDKVVQIEKLKSKIRSNGGRLPEHQNERLDEICITPGTSFMSYLADCLRYFIYVRINKDPAWCSTTVILSDSNVPGEGEHKIMNYIRQKIGDDPDTHHVLYGNDADLIILGLATHKKNITIMRAEFNLPLCDICEQSRHSMEKCEGIIEEKLEKPDEIRYIFVHLSVLRKHLYRDLTIPDELPFVWNLNRAIDDWVFLCLLVGNDFLPNIPSLEIRENVIDLLKKIYINNVTKVKDYLTNEGVLNMAFMKIILTSIGASEDEIFKNRPRVTQQVHSDSQSQGVPVKPLDINEIKSSSKKPVPMTFGPPSFRSKRPDSSATISSNSQINKPITTDTKREISSASASSLQPDAHPREQNNDPQDSVRLWEEGWHERYYKSKFNMDQSSLKETCMQVVEHYTQGLCWVLQYYYKGVPSWNWYYSYHYAPFASDFSSLEDVSAQFDDNSKPLKPLEQLMSVFPPQYAKYLPDKWQLLVEDKDSLIIDFYPLNFNTDPNGKLFKSQYVALLPFVDEKRLHKILQTHYSSLTSEEKKRNEHENALLFVHSKNSFRIHLKDKLAANSAEKITQENPIRIPDEVGIVGHIWPDDNKIIPIGETVTTTMPGYINILNGHVTCYKYRN